MIIVFLLLKKCFGTNTNPNKQMNILQFKKQICQKWCLFVVWLSSRERNNLLTDFCSRNNNIKF